MRFVEFKLYETGFEVVPVRSNRGLEVANLQKALVALGFDVGSTGVDGILGPRTRNAVRQFQQSANIRVDGSPGPETANAVMQRLRSENKLADLTPATDADIDRAARSDAGRGLAAGDTTTGNGSGRVEEIQRDVAGIRKLPISNRLKSVLQAAAEEVRVDVVVTSGGQMSMADYQRASGRKTNSGGRSPTYYLDGRAVRKGSTRHDGGNAADLHIKSDGRLVPLDTPLMNSFISACFKHGAEGGGGSPGYMGNTTIHIDVIGTSHGGGRTWSSTRQFMASVNRGLASRGRA